jgi:hypothetical protein
LLFDVGVYRHMFGFVYPVTRADVVLTLSEPIQLRAQRGAALSGF